MYSEKMSSCTCFFWREAERSDTDDPKRRYDVSVGRTALRGLFMRCLVSLLGREGPGWGNVRCCGRLAYRQRYHPGSRCLWPDRCPQRSYSRQYLEGGWQALVYVDDQATQEQQDALLAVFTGKLGRPIADTASLIGEVVGVERVPITFTVEEGKGTLAIGETVHAEMAPFTGPTGEVT